LVLTSPEGDFFPLSWCSKRQTAVARSTTEAEIASVNEGVFSEGIPFKQVLEILWKRPVSTELMEDNSACVTILQTGYSPKLRAMSRTHRISIAALKEALDANHFIIIPTPTKDQLADIFTKALNKIQFLEMRSRIGVAPTKDPKVPTGK
jgi:hypothetical protein